MCSNHINHILSVEVRSIGCECAFLSVSMVAPDECDSAVSYISSNIINVLLVGENVRAAQLRTLASVYLNQYAWSSPST